jgi:hypothetical protein
VLIMTVFSLSRRTWYERIERRGKVFQQRQQRIFVRSFLSRWSRLCSVDRIAQQNSYFRDLDARVVQRDSTIHDLDARIDRSDSTIRGLCSDLDTCAMDLGIQNRRFGELEAVVAKKSLRLVGACSDWKRGYDSLQEGKIYLQKMYDSLQTDNSSLQGMHACLVVAIASLQKQRDKESPVTLFGSCMLFTMVFYFFGWLASWLASWL